MEALTFFPHVLQYHPRLVAAAHLQWVLDNQINKGQPLQVPSEVCGHAWYAFIDPAIDASDIMEVKEAISEGLNFFVRLQ